MAVRTKVNVQRRIALFVGLLLCGIAGLCGRIAWVQLVQGEELAAREEHQVGESRILQSPRGTIYDSKGRELAVSMMTKSLYVDPSQVRDAKRLAADLSPILELKAEEIEERIAIGGGFVWLKRRMEPEAVEKVRALIREQELNCLNFQEESKRYYPNDQLAAQVLGFVGTDDIGLEGIELVVDGTIKGQMEKRFVLTDKNSWPIFQSTYSDKGFERCKNVYLTLDNTVQFVVEQALDRAMVETKPKAITAIVMDPKTGDVLAMANRPTYNPNRFYEYSYDEWRNRAVSFVYEPGSTFKAVVAAAALQEGLVTPQKVFVDPGYVMVSGRKIQNWNHESFGTVTFTDIIKNSINTGFVQIGMEVGAQRLDKYVRLFGFGEATGIELPGEESGILFNPKEMRDSDLATMSIGQSIAVTPIQLAAAMSAIANNGALLKPHIIRSVAGPDGATLSERQVETVRRAIDESTAATLTSMLEQVVASGGGQKASVKGYRIAGKTGTAEKISHSGGGYLEGHYIASFCGFAPVEDPRITVLIMIDDPDGVYYGGQIAAPIAGEIFERVLRYLNVKPHANYLEIKPPVEPPKPAPKAAAAAAPQGKALVPDLTGKSLRQALEDLSALGLRMKPSGSGVAVRQSISPNTIVDPGTEVEVHFDPG